jgi:hypothetical protein
MYREWCPLLRNYVKQGLSSQANSISPGQETPLFYGTQRFITAFSKTGHWTPFWVTWIHILYFKIHFNIIPIFSTRSYKWSLPFSVSDQTSCKLCISYPLISCYMSCASHSSLFDHSHNMCARSHFLRLWKVQKGLRYAKPTDHYRS